MVQGDCSTESLHSGQLKHGSPPFYTKPTENGTHPLPVSDTHRRKVSGSPKQNGSVPHQPRENENVQLKRHVGLLSGISLIVGTMIGSGIFISPKGVLRGTGSVGLSFVVWAGCGLLAMLGALCYAELGTMITKSGAEYPYLMDSFGPFHPVLGPIPGFLYSWVSILVLRPSAFAVLALSFGLYVAEPFYRGCDQPPEMIIKLIAALCLLFIAFINCYSVKLATYAQNITTLIKLAAIAVIVIGGFVKIAQGNVEFLAEGFDDTAGNPSVIALAFYDGLWAYDGWNNLNYVTEEIKNPQVNLPRAIIIGIPLVTICYLLVNVSYLSVISKEELLMSSAVAVTWSDRVLGLAAILIPISVAFSTFGAANGTCFTGGRLVYVAAREGHLPKVLSYVHVKRLTPLTSLIFTTFIAVLMIIPGNIFSLIDFFSFTAWFFYGLTMLALIIMRRTKKDTPRPYKVPLAIPYIMLIASIYLVIAPIIQNPQMEFLYAFLFIFSGLIFYFPFVHYKMRIRGVDKITQFIQVLLDIAPSKYEPAA